MIDNDDDAVVVGENDSRTRIIMMKTVKTGKTNKITNGETGHKGKFQLVILTCPTMVAASD